MPDPIPIYLQGPLPNHCNDWELEFKARAVSFLASQDELVLVEVPEAAEIILWFESNRFRNWRHIDPLIQNEMLQRFTDKIFTVNYEDNPPGFLPGFYTGLESTRIREGFHVPWNYVFHSNNQLEQQRHRNQSCDKKYLFSFRGATSHPVRQEILNRLPNTPQTPITHSKFWFNHPEEVKKAYIQEIRASEFVLCPRGISPSSIRLFEVMQLGSVPVILSDAWAPVPGPNWDECSVRIRESQITSLPNILKDLQPRAKMMGIQARKEWERWFSQPNNLIHMVKKAFEMRMERMSPLNLTDLANFWNSHDFRKKNGWLFYQRVTNKFSRILREKN